MLTRPAPLLRHRVVDGGARKCAPGQRDQNFRVRGGSPNAVRHGTQPYEPLFSRAGPGGFGRPPRSGSSRRPAAHDWRGRRATIPGPAVNCVVGELEGHQREVEDGAPSRCGAIRNQPSCHCFIAFHNGCGWSRSCGLLREIFGGSHWRRPAE